jgi:hypothetical protein
VETVLAAIGHQLSRNLPDGDGFTGDATPVVMSGPVVSRT